MTRNEKVFDLLYSNSLAWEAKKIPLVAQITEDGNEGDESIIKTTLKTDSFGIFRSDNNKHLGTVKDRYEVFQNKELAGVIVDACDGLDLEVRKGGLLAGGKKVFLQIALPDEKVGNSGIKRYLTALNSHDGSCSIGFGTTNTVIVCKNTFYSAMRDVQNIRHTQSYSEKVEKAMQRIRQAIVGENLLMDNFKRMSDIKIKDEQFIVDLVSKVLSIDKGEEASTRKTNQVRVMADNIRTDINIHGDNLWGLFNGITRYTNHSQVKSDKSLENVMVGQGSRINELAFKEIMKQVEASLGATILV
jgi:phage/plasmid-like protein (TIGR03299 family)